MLITKYKKAQDNFDKFAEIHRKSTVAIFCIAIFLVIAMTGLVAMVLLKWLGVI
jgi:hypothetical protein